MEDGDKAELGLEPVPGPNDEEHFAIIARPGVKAYERGRDRLLVKVGDKYNEHLVKWVLLQWSSEADGALTHEILAHGAGCAGPLREPRHTYFGEDGYVFYVRPAVLTWAFGVLAEWFNFDE